MNTGKESFQMIISEEGKEISLELIDYESMVRTKFEAGELKEGAIITLCELLIQKTKPLFKQVADETTSNP